MKDSVPNPQLQTARISATVSTGFAVTTANGKPARLAIIDEAAIDVAWFSPDCKHFSKAAQVRMCGNSVCPPVSAALVRANLADHQQNEEAA